MSTKNAQEMMIRNQMPKKPFAINAKPQLKCDATPPLNLHAIFLLAMSLLAFFLIMQNEVLLGIAKEKVTTYGTKTIYNQGEETKAIRSFITYTFTRREGPPCASRP